MRSLFDENNGLNEQPLINGAIQNMRSLFEENNGLSEQSLVNEAIQNILSYLEDSYLENKGIVPETLNIVWTTVLN